MKPLRFFFLPLIMLCSCVYLRFDETKAAPLVLVSRTPTPSFEEVRSFVQYGDLVYVAAGSGGLLVYRTVGDRMQAVPALSISNVYADGLSPAFIRTVEIVEGKNSTNLIFAFDTVTGGGIGAAEITPAYTKPLGSLASIEGMRIRRTDSRPDPDGGFRILAANEYAGVINCRLTVLSNNFFDQKNLASLAGYVAVQGLGGGVMPFERLQPPGTESIQNITNFEGLLSLFRKDPQKALEIASNLPFLSDDQRKRIEETAKKAGIFTNTNLLAAAAGMIGESNTSQVAELARQFLQGSNIMPQAVAPELTPPAEPAPAGTEKTEDYYLSNIAALADFAVDPELVNTPDFNPFTVNRPIKDAGIEIDSTAAAYGRQNTADDQGILKDRLHGLTTGEQDAMFGALFNQSDLLARLVPLLETSGFNPRQLYQIWQEGGIGEIIDKLDTSLLADMIKLLPQTQIEVKLSIEGTNAVLPSVRNMSTDARSLYLALGKEGFAVIERATGKILAKIKKDFSEVESVAPFEAYGKKYLAVADRLNGLTIYERLKNDAPGEETARLNLVGEGMSLYAQNSLLWVADGSNGVIAVRFMKDKTLRIEGEFFEKEGVARYIGTARPREALVSYGADGFVRLRFTNIAADEDLPKPADELQEQKTLAQKTIEWNNSSPFFRFLRRLFL